MVLVLALLKRIEYVCLGMALSWVGQRTWGERILAYVAVGLAAGVLFGSLTLALAYWGTPSPPSTADVVSRGVNEMLFPVGCSVALYAAGVLEKRAH